MLSVGTLDWTRPPSAEQNRDGRLLLVAISLFAWPTDLILGITSNSALSTNLNAVSMKQQSGSLMTYVALMPNDYGCTNTKPAVRTSCVPQLSTTVT